jgi:hypothetical protein
VMRPPIAASCEASWNISSRGALPVLRTLPTLA